LLFEREIIAPAIVPPAVRAGSARLRLCASSAQDTAFLAAVLAEVVDCLESLPRAGAP